MTPEIAQFSNRGMNQDISVSKATNEFAFKNYNIRITAVNDNTLLSVTNEKGPIPINVELKQAAIYNKLNVSLKGAFDGNTAISKLIISSEYTTDTQIQLSIKLKYYEGGIVNLVHSIPAGIKDYEYSLTTRYKSLERAVISSVGEYDTTGSKYSYYTQFETKPSFKFLKDTLNYIPGTYLGHAIINNNLVLFTHEDEGFDYIISLQYDEAKGFIGKTHYIGNINFSVEHPIETLPYYESELVQKVYWVDGINQPRVINIASDSIVERLDTQFDFNPTITKFPEVTITKEYNGVGLFPAGVIQYFISYYNKYGAETSVVWASDLQYITEYNRAAGPDETVVCNFKIQIDNIDTSYDYIRVYSMQRTSLNTEPICRIVADINTNNSDSITVSDANSNTEIIDPTMLLFLGGNTFIASTLTQKDDTLFLGDLKVDNLTIPDDVKEAFANVYDITEDSMYVSKIVTFGQKIIPDSDDFQLQKSEKSIKTFKKGELYRFALQFQTADSKWTTPIWIGDKVCDITPSYGTDDKTRVATAKVTLDTDVKKLLSKYYINYRLLMAEPTNADRKILAQGILNPTVFNYEQRVNGTGPYVQASWSLRPRNGRAAFEHLEGLGNKVIKNNNDELEFINLETCEIQNSLNKLPGIIADSENKSGFLVSVFIKGYSCKYTIYKVTGESLDDFGSAEEKIAEEYSPTSDLEDSASWVVSSLKDKLHLEEDAELGIDEKQMYNVLYGIIYGAGEIPDGTITDTWKYGWISESKDGIVLMPCGVSYTIRYGGLTGYIEASNTIVDYTNEYLNNYYVDSSIVTFHSPEIENNESLFDGSNLRYQLIGVVPIKEVVSKVDLTVNPVGYSKISGVTDSNVSDSLNAYTNKAIFKDVGWSTDDVINPSSLVSYYVYLWNKTGSLIGQTVESKQETNNVNETESITTEYAVLNKKLIANRYIAGNIRYFKNYISMSSGSIVPTVWNSTQISTKLLHTYEKPVYYQGNCDYLAPTTTYRTLKSSLNYYKSFWKTYSNFDKYSEKLNQTAPVRIKYKTMPHLVFELYGGEGMNGVLPRLYNTEPRYDDKLSLEYERASDIMFPWANDSNPYGQGLLSHDLNETVDTPYFYLCDIYRDVLITSENAYGGVSENAIEAIKWIPASTITSLSSNISESFGDTYYQMWDCLHSYPYTREDENSVIDIVSFMVETHVNLEGRYDKNKITQELLGVNEETYTKVNPVYSQLNNYFTYNILDEKFNQTEYGNQVAFSLQKTPTSDIDTWCNITLASSFNLNGLYGKLTKLINVNDSILAFQDKALSVINFNNRTALSTESGVPIEIANSGKVNGYSVISSNIGCQNKQSICQASSGVYFIDDYNKTMYGFNKEGISNISAKGMSMWFKKNLTGKEKTFYDSLTNDVYVTNANDCLVFNEGLQAFTSFMDYNNINALFNFNGYSLMLDKDEQDAIIPKKMFSGDYTNNYSIEYKINPEPLVDKTFGNIEFIADCVDERDVIDSDSVQYHSNIKPFDLLQVWNEYQRGATNLHTARFKYPNSEKKFRIWRVDIPRDTTHNKLDRIRNPWIYLKLSNSTSHTNKMVFHNLLVKYYK